MVRSRIKNNLTVKTIARGIVYESHHIRLLVEEDKRKLYTK